MMAGSDADMASRISPRITRRGNVQNQSKYGYEESGGADERNPAGQSPGLDSSSQRHQFRGFVWSVSSVVNPGPYRCTTEMPSGEFDSVIVSSSVLPDCTRCVVSETSLAPLRTISTLIGYS